MKSLYSYILWEKLGLGAETYKIHEKDYPEILKEFQRHMKNVGTKQFLKDVSYLSPFDSIEEDEELYYDGPFYHLQSSVHKDFITQDPDDPNRMIVKTHFHITSVDPMTLFLLLSFTDPDRAKFFADIVKSFRDQEKEENE